MWHEPNCFIDLDVYKDWIYEFNNNDDLRNIDFVSLVSGDDYNLNYHQNEGVVFNDIGIGTNQFDNGVTFWGDDNKSFGSNCFCYSFLDWQEYYPGDGRGVLFQQISFGQGSHRGSSGFDRNLFRGSGS